MNAPSPTPPLLSSLFSCRAVGLNLTIDDFQRVSDRVPFIADLKPSGKYVMEDVHKVRRALASCMDHAAPVDRIWLATVPDIFST